jgi:hypothetical protein
MVAAGSLKPGALLPTIRQLAADLPRARDGTGEFPGTAARLLGADEDAALDAVRRVWDRF